MQEDEGSNVTQAMLKRTVPSTGELLPVIGCGSWQTFDVGASISEREPLRDVLRTLFDNGGSLIDSSPMYGKAEAAIGDLLDDTGTRAKAFTATKVWTRGREAGIAQMTRSMRLLKADSLDLIQVHNLLDWQIHLPTLHDWKERGRIRYVGVTHYTTGAHDQLASIMRTEPIDFVQFNYALDDRAAERSLLPLAAERGIAVLVNRPFGEGALIRRLSLRPVPDFASEIGCTTWAELALKYLLADSAVTCLIPATRQPGHMESNARSGADPLPNAQMRRRILAAAGL
jgi:diketogulonate reductase-like aldo/keto reductase